MTKLQRQLRYRALSDIIVGGRLLFTKSSIFMCGEQFGTSLVQAGRAELLAALEQPPPPPAPDNGKRHKRRPLAHPREE